VILSGQSLLLSFGCLVGIWIFGLWLRHALRTDFPQYLDQHQRIFERLEKSNYSVDFADFVKCFLGGKVTDCLPLSVCFLRQSANIAVIS
jgi:hypothetical protein